MTHTKGPWEIRDIFGHGPTLLSDRNKVVARFDINGPNDEDASLICAAPDLLAALQALVDWETLPHGAYKQKYGLLFVGSDKVDDAADAKHRQQVADARAAIAKAETE